MAAGFPSMAGLVHLGTMRTESPSRAFPRLVAALSSGTSARTEPPGPSRSKNDLPPLLA